MKVVPEIKGETLIDFAKKGIEPGSMISSDAYHSIERWKELVLSTNIKFIMLKESPDHLNWLHTTLSNAKAFIGGTFHGLGSKHLQSYLDVFCYRFNCRKF